MRPNRQTLAQRLRSLIFHEVTDQDIDAELSFHVEMRTLDNLAAGMSAEAASTEALRRFGDVELIKRNCRKIDATTSRKTFWCALLWLMALGGLAMRMSHPVEQVRMIGEILVANAILLRLLLYVRAIPLNKSRPGSDGGNFTSFS